MTALHTEWPVALYRLFDAGGELLYIGISGGPWQRFTQHAADKPWWPGVVRAEIEWYPAREIAEQAERDAIRAEFPRHNTRHAMSPEAWAALERAVSAAQRADALKAQAWLSIKAARDAGVLDTDLCEQTGRSRATLHRKFGPRSA